MASSLTPHDLCSDLLSCVICFEAFTDDRVPKALPCLHTLCSDCLRNTIHAHRNNLYQVRSLDSDTHFPCPICKHAVHIPPYGVDGFRNDFRIRRLSEALEQVLRMTNTTTKEVRVDGKDRIKPERCEDLVPAVILHGEKCEDRVPAVSLNPDKCEDQMPAIMLDTERCENQLHGDWLSAVTLLSNRCEDQVPAVMLPPGRCEKQVPAVRLPCERCEHQVHAVTLPSERCENRVPAVTLSSGRCEAVTLPSGRCAECHHREAPGYCLDCSQVLCRRCSVKHVRSRRGQAHSVISVKDAWSSIASFKQRAVEQPGNARQSCSKLLKWHSDLSGRFIQKDDMTPASQTPSSTLSQPRRHDNNTSIRVESRIHKGLTFQGQREFKAKLLKVIGRRGCSDGEFNFPASVAVLSNGDITVSDMHNSRVQIFDAEGNFKHKFGEAGFKPCGMAVTQDGNIAVTDCRAGVNCIKVFTPAGRLIQHLGIGEFEYPFSLAVDTHGRYIVCDPAISTITVLNRDGSVRTKFPTKSKFPFYVTVNTRDEILVSDWYNHHVKVFSSIGRLLRTIGTEGEGEGQLLMPLGLACDLKNNVYVVDCKCKRVSMFTVNGRFVRHVVSVTEDLVHCRAVALSHSQSSRFITTHGDNKQVYPNEIRIYQM